MDRPYIQDIHSIKRTKTISITSGKGGVGKTTIVSNIAYNLGQQGHKVLILDGDLGMANVDIMFGKKANKSIQDVISGKLSMEEILIDVSENVSLIPGGSGIYGLHSLNFFHKQMLLDQVGQLEKSFDYMIIDTAPGIDDNVLYLNAAAQEITVVTNPDPSSLTDAYALIKVLNIRHHENKFSVLCNNVRDEVEAKAIFNKLSDVAARFLCVSLSYMGYIPQDLELRDATKLQQLIVKTKPQSVSSRQLYNISKKLSYSDGIHELKGGIQFFWQQLSGVA